MQIQHNLAEYQQAESSVIAGKPNNHGGRHDRQQACYQTAEPGLDSDVEETLHHDLPGQRSGERGGLTRTKQRHAEQLGCHHRAQQRRQQEVRLLDLRHRLVGTEEHGGSQHQDSSVHEKGTIQGHHAVDEIPPAGGRLFRLAPPNLTGLHQGGVEIQVVRHHRGTQHAHRRIQAPAIYVWHQTEDDAVQVRFGHVQFYSETARNHPDEAQNKSLQPTDTQFLQPQHQQGVQGSYRHARQQRNVEQEIEGNGSPQNFGKIARDDGDFAEEPKRSAHAAGIRLPACLRQVAPGNDPEPGAQGLQQDRHRVRHDEDPKQAVAEIGSAVQIRGPVARVHVSHGNQVSRAGKGHPSLPFGKVVCRDRLVNFGQGFCVRPAHNNSPISTPAAI